MAENLNEDLVQQHKDFPRTVAEHVVELFEIDPSSEYVGRSGSLDTVVNEVHRRLNYIKLIFRDEKSYNSWIAPSKVRDRVKQHHKKILDALNLLRSFRGPVLIRAEEDLLERHIKQQLYSVSNANPAISPGLVGYDVSLFDADFSNALKSVEKVEGYFSRILSQAESEVQNRGENKPKNLFADHMLADLCDLFRDMTGENPKAYITNDEDEPVRGRIIPFLDYILRLLPYSHEITDVALETKLRRLKSDKTQDIR